MVKWLAVVLLFFNGAGAVFGGGSLLLYPDGSAIGLPLDLLDGTGFSDFRWPGLVLFLSNGLFSFLVIVALLMRRQRAPFLLMTQGVVLLVWLTAELFIIRYYFFLQSVMAVVGFAMVILGMMMCGWNNAATQGGRRMQVEP